VASQVTDAQWDATAVLVSGQDGKGELVFKATGRVLVFDGHFRVTGLPNASEEAVLPPVEEGKQLGALQFEPIQNFTAPRPLHGSLLVRKLEAEGIGRPSTYAQIIQVIQNRKYVEKSGTAFTQRTWAKS